MENQENWSTGNTGLAQGNQELKGGQPSLILGIIGLVLSLLTCGYCSFIGFILSIIAFVKGKSAIREYEANPSLYAESGYKNAKTGKVLGLIGLILGIIVIVIFTILLATGVLMEIMREMK